jgi:DNA-binding protein YbaB
MNEYNDRLDAEIERADRKIAETRARVSAHLSRNGQVTGRATSTDGAITVTVGPGGRLVDVEIDNSALTMKPEQLADALVNVARQATRDANGRMHQSIRTVVGREVADSLTQLGIGPAAEPDDATADWLDTIRRQR